MAKGDDIRDRLMTLAVSVTRICSDLPKQTSSRHIVNQLLRSVTSAAANYAEARAAESRKDFIHKLRVVLKELNESLVWLQLLKRLRYINEEVAGPALTECAELCRIIAASIKTASRKNG